MTAFPNLPQSTPLLSINWHFKNEWVTGTIKEPRALQKVNLTNIRNGLDDTHKDIAKRSNAKQNAAVDSYSHKKNVHTISFDVGDYVLRGTREQ